jgi:ACT domain-containing protein
MDSTAKTARTNMAIQVIQHVNQGMTVVDACREVGISRSSFYYLWQSNPRAFAEVQDIIAENSRRELMMILLTKTQILERVIQEGLADTTKPQARLAIYKTLNAQLDKLIEELRESNQDDSIDREFLSGPVLEPGINRF